MLTDLQLADLIEQEIDFIGQLYVEYEQLTSYEDILISAEKIRSLASLFYDFIDRIAHVLKNGEVIATSDKALEFTPNSPAADFFQQTTIESLQPFLTLYNRYSEVYPQEIEPDKIVEMYHQFPQVTERVAGDLRNAAYLLRKHNAR